MLQCVHASACMLQSHFWCASSAVAEWRMYAVKMLLHAQALQSELLDHPHVLLLSGSLMLVYISSLSCDSHLYKISTYTSQ